MTEPKASASGPLWAAAYDGLPISPEEVHEGDMDDGDTPCRLLPGHGKWVPAELVEAIENYYSIDDWQMVGAAIRAAKEGAV